MIIKSKTSRLLAMLLALLTLTGCDAESSAETDSDTEIQTEAIVETEPEIPSYATVESLIEADSIISVEQAEYTELETVDLSAFPESIAEVYRGLQEDILTYQVLYTVDECTVSAFISVPKDYQSAPLPLIIYNRGGNGNFSANNALLIATYAELSGYAVIASNYRETSPGTGTDEFGGADVNDVLFWMDFVDELAFIDREKVYMIGESRGGMQTCLVLKEDDDDLIRAAACAGGVYDVAYTYEVREDMRAMLERRIGGTPEACPEEYEKRSAVTFADEIDTPILLIHSTGDEKSPYEDAEEFAEKLQSFGKTYELWTREDNVHAIASFEEFRETVKWLEVNGD